MPLFEKVSSDIIAAMKARDKVRFKEYKEKLHRSKDRSRRK